MQKRISPLLPHNLILAYGHNEEERKHLLPKYFPRRLKIYETVWHCQYSTLSFEWEEYFYSRERHFEALIVAAGQLATFFFHLYINFNIFFSHLSEEKKWESGQKTRKPLGRNGFSLATFENKSGQKVGKWPIFRHFRFFFRTRIKRFLASSETKVGKWPIFGLKVASKPPQN